MVGSVERPRAAKKRPAHLDANYRRVRPADDLGSQQALSMVVHASGSVLLLLYSLLYDVDALILHQHLSHGVA